MSLASAQHLLDEFNDGNWEEVGAYFNEDFELFMDFLTKYGLDSEIDYFNIDEDFQNKLLLLKLEKYPEDTLKFICDNLVTDVYPMKDGYYLFLKEREEMANLFKSYSRETSPNDAAKAVLSEDMWDPFWDTTDDVYRDVIEDLDESNLQALANYILKQIGDKELPTEDYESDFFHELANSQGVGDFFQIRSENIYDLIKDEEAMNELLNGDLDELKSELYSIHNSAYNSAYESEVYDRVWSELEQYFVPQSWEYEQQERRDGKKVTNEYIKIKDFYNDIHDFLSNNQQPQWREQYLGYYGNYCSFIRQMMEDGEKEWLSFRVPEWADWDITKKIINEIFGDYI